MADLMTQEEREARVVELRSRISELNVQYQDQVFPPEAEIEWNRANAEIEEQTKVIAQLRKRRERVAELDGNPAAREPGATFHTSSPNRTRFEDIHDLSTVRMSADSPESAVGEMRERAKRYVERMESASDDADIDKTRARAEKLLRRDPKGEFARHLLVVGSPLYERAFFKTLARQPLSPDEQRAMTISTPAEGGYAVPVTLDPTVIMTSDWSVNPLRAISRVETITGNTWHGLTSAGVTGSYGYKAEATEQNDNSPAFGRPVLNVQRGDIYAQFSIELGQDWSGLASELGRMFGEAKDDIEAEKFLKGAGASSDEPEGLLEGATELVDSDEDEAFDIVDLYATKNALPPRFRNRARWIANQETYDLIRLMGVDDSSGSTVLRENLTLATSADQVPGPGALGYSLLGKPASEASQMDTMPDTFDGDVPLMVYGDFRHFLIADRVGSWIQYNPVVTGAGGRPTGEVGISFFWRNSSLVLAPEAFRVLNITEAS